MTLALTDNLIKSAASDASKAPKMSLPIEDSDVIAAEALNGSVERLNAVAFVLATWWQLEPSYFPLALI